MSAPAARPAFDAPAAKDRLTRAEALFEAGNFRALRAELPALRDAGDPAMSARADQLARATSEDPAFAAVIAACLLGLFAIVARYILG
jgi:hypothetical protein